jgi:hypothetical protein
MERTQDYQRRAELAERQAREAVSEGDVEAFERVAAAWRQLADDAARQDEEGRL